MEGFTMPTKKDLKESLELIIYWLAFSAIIGFIAYQIFWESFNNSIWFGLALGAIPAAFLEFELRTKRKRNEKYR